MVLIFRESNPIAVDQRKTRAQSDLPPYLSVSFPIQNGPPWTSTSNFVTRYCKFKETRAGRQQKRGIGSSAYNHFWIYPFLHPSYFSLTTLHPFICYLNISHRNYSIFCWKLILKIWNLCHLANKQHVHARMISMYLKGAVANSLRVNIGWAFII